MKMNQTIKRLGLLSSVFSSLVPSLPAQQQVQGTPASQYMSFGNNAYSPLNITNTMNFNDCHQFKMSKTGKICILMKAVDAPDNVCPQLKKYNISCIASMRGQFDYREPSELIEVSCRKGYSMLLPQGVGEVPRNQSCFGEQNGNSRRWFFDVRDWAINGDSGMARAQGHGEQKRKQAAACGLNHPANPEAPDAPEGYGIKHDFGKGGGGGPGGSWEAYISDPDPDWALDKSKSLQENPQPFKPCTGTDVNNCWGNVQPYSGWVNHPHRPVAAALIAWRAHNKAQGKVSAPGDYYNMDMDYPYVMHTSVFGQTQGLKGGIAAGGTQGSRCFMPGDPGPWWFNNQQEGEGIAPDQIANKVIEKVNGLQGGDTTQAADLHTGTYIFTIWVGTACVLYSGIAGTNVQQAINGCKDSQEK